MGRKQGSRKGSMQFWPRKRSQRAFPRVNWAPLNKDGGLLGFIGYKVGMRSAYVKDSTNDSMTKNKRIAVPVTIVECPTMKIFSIRLTKHNKPVLDIINNNVDKEMKRVLKLPKEVKTKELLEKAEKEADFDDVTVIVYSQVKKTNLKTKPDVQEIGLSGSKEDKIAWVKENLPKEISIKDVFSEGVLDIRGVTTGRGFQGVVKRFGVSLRNHKAEKGQRSVGSIGPWHPARVMFTVPMGGQMGLHNRVIYNNKIVAIESISEKDINPKSGFKKYGVIKNDYIILEGCVQGPSKRQVLLTSPLRPTKKQLKKNYELIDLR